MAPLNLQDFVEQHVAQVRSCEADMLVGIGFDLDHPSPMMHMMRLAQSVGGMLQNLRFHTGLQTPRRTPARAGSATPTASGGSSSTGSAAAEPVNGAEVVGSKEEAQIMNIALGLINDR
jgi:hypothetical protein